LGRPNAFPEAARRRGTIFKNEADELSTEKEPESFAMGAIALGRGFAFTAVADGHTASAFHFPFHGRFTSIFGFVGTVTVGFICRFTTGTIVLGSWGFIDIVG
jgi:hypothetical protein